MRSIPSSIMPGRAALHRQRGVAVIMALLLATLASTIVASLFWQQQVQVRSIENQRLQLQKEWILRGALDWARLILREDGKNSAVAYLSEPWATPLAETRLDQYVQDGDAGADASGAVLSGYIVDAQSRYNLTSLVANGKIDAAELKTFSRLLNILHLDAGLALPIAQAVAGTLPAATASNDGTAAAINVKLPFQNVDDLLAVPGVTPAFVDGLKDFATILPQATAINVNTASAEVLAARLDTLSTAQVTSLVDFRARNYYPSLADFRQQLGVVSPAQVATGPLSVGTDYFIVKGKVRMGRAALESWSLIQRSGSGAGTGTKVIWSR